MPLLLTSVSGPSLRLTAAGVVRVGRISRICRVRLSLIGLAASMMTAFSFDPVEFFFESNVEILVPSAGFPSITQLPAFGGRHVALLLDAYQGPGLRVPSHFRIIVESLVGGPGGVERYVPGLRTI